MKIGIAATTYHEELMEQMLKLALEKADELEVDVFKILRVPGSFELPLACQKLLDEGADGVIGFGIIVTGETKHDELIGHAVGKAFQDLALKYKKPVMLGVTGPGQTYGQAAERVPRAAAIMEACVKMVEELGK